MHNVTTEVVPKVNFSFFKIESITDLTLVSANEKWKINKGKAMAEFDTDA
jgi:hypothetical protein